VAQASDGQRARCPGRRVGGSFRSLEGPVARRVLLVAHPLWLLLVLWVAQRQRLGSTDAGLVVSLLFMALFVGSEILFSRSFEGRATPAERRPPRWLARLSSILRPLLLVGVYVVVVEIGAWLDPFEENGPFKPTFLFLLWWRLWAELSLQPLLTLLGIALVWSLVEGVVIRRRQGRVLVMMILPVLLTVTLMHFRYSFIVPVDPARIKAQEGVSILFDAEDVADPERRQVWSHPRRLLVEESPWAAFVGFGQSWGGEAYQRSYLWRIDLDTGAVSVLKSEQCRAITPGHDGEHIYAFPVHNYELLKIDKRGFWLDARIQTPMDLVPVAAPLVEEILGVNESLYVGQNMHPALFEYDQRAGRFTRALDLVEAGLARVRDYCCRLRHVAGSDALYVGIGSYERPEIHRLDLRSLEHVDTYPMPAMAGDLVVRGRQDPSFYIVSEFDGDVYRMDPRTREWSRFADGALGARLTFDAHLDRLLVLMPARGTLSTLAPDGRVEREVLVGPWPADLSVTEAGVYVATKAGLVFVSHRGLAGAP
jgi:hypothetical protein